MADQLICGLCKNDNGEEEVTKQKCGHIICWKCLGENIVTRLAAKIVCPIAPCDKFLSDRAVRKVLSDEDIQRYEIITLGLIPQKIECLLPGCGYSVITADDNLKFECGKCSLFNCVSCKAAHMSLTCAQFKSSEEMADFCQMEMERATRILKLKQVEKNREMFKEMDDMDLLLHDNLLECPTCSRHLSRGDGIILRCSHLFCRFCLSTHINTTAKIPITCPTEECYEPLEEREIMQLINEEERTIYVDRCFSAAKGKLDFICQCQTPNCIYFVTYSTKPQEVHCPLCKATNCVLCSNIHTGETCEAFKERIKSTPYGQNLLFIEEKIRNKELMRCLKCQQLLQKITGCSWIRCTSCRFEMCWALQMRRWGPGGRGDESDGCKCQILGPRCAPDCGSCEPHLEGNEQPTIDINELLRMMFFMRLRELLEL